MHDPCFAERTLDPVESGKAYNPLLSSFFHLSFRLFILQRLKLIFLFAAQYAIIPDLYETVGQYVHAESAEELNA